MSIHNLYKTKLQFKYTVESGGETHNPNTRYLDTIDRMESRIENRKSQILALQAQISNLESECKEFKEISENCQSQIVKAEKESDPLYTDIIVGLEEISAFTAEVWRKFDTIKITDQILAVYRANVPKHELQEIDKIYDPLRNINHALICIAPNTRAGILYETLLKIKKQQTKQIN